MELATQVWSGLDSVRTPIQPKVMVGESPKSHIAKTASRKGLVELVPSIALRAPPPLDKYFRFRTLFCDYNQETSIWRQPLTEFRECNRKLIFRKILQHRGRQD